jgi:hypothetical protein
MPDQPASPAVAEVVPAGAGPQVDPLLPAAEVTLPPGVQPSRNYLAAVELGHVLAASNYYRDATDPAQAAVKVMIGMDLGVSPTAAIQGIHTMEENGKVIFLTETKLLAAVVKGRPDVEYKIVKREPEFFEAEFLRRNAEGEWEAEGPNISWTLEHARKVVKGFDKKPTWKFNGIVMLGWRVLSEGFRLYFPDVLAGQPIYTLEEFDADADDMRLKEAMAPAKPVPLNDAKAENLREEARKVYDELKAINPDRLVAGRFAQMVASAEHSHARLETVVGSLVDLRDTEKTIAERSAELEELVGEKEAKPTIERAERRGSNRDRIAVLDKAIAEVKAKEEKPADGEAPEAPAEAPVDGDAPADA